MLTFKLVFFSENSCGQAVQTQRSCVSGWQITSSIHSKKSPCLTLQESPVWFKSKTKWDFCLCTLVLLHSFITYLLGSFLFSDLGGLRWTERHKRSAEKPVVCGGFRQPHSGKGAAGSFRQHPDSLLCWRSLHPEWLCTARWQDCHLESWVESIWKWPNVTIC